MQQNLMKNSGGGSNNAVLGGSPSNGAFKKNKMNNSSVNLSPSKGSGANSQVLGGSGGGAAAASNRSKYFKNKSASSSMENINAASLNAAPPSSHNKTLLNTQQRAASPKIFINSQTDTTTAASADQVNRSGSRKQRLVKTKPVMGDSANNSFEMNRSDTMSSVSQHGNQQQQQQQPAANPTITLTEAPGGGAVSPAPAPRDKLKPTMPGSNGSFDVPIGSAKSVVHALFQNGFLNMDAQIAEAVANSAAAEADEIKSKESYCNLWVTAHSNTNLSTRSKSPSEANLNNVGGGALFTVKPPDEVPYHEKTEEELQREYLVNLLSQLENEQQQHQQRNNNLKVCFYIISY
jgi:hypothetical protein